MQHAGKRPKAQTPASSTTPRLLYLTAYNTIFATLWVTIFYRAISQISAGKTSLFNETSSLARWVQTASLIEVAHAALGVIPSPISTTALQVVTRVIQVWMV